MVQINEDVSQEKNNVKKVLTKRFKILNAYEQYCVAHTGIGSGESEIVYLYATSLRKITEHVLPTVKDDLGEIAIFKKDITQKVRLIDVADCDYRKILHVEDFPKSNYVEADLSFLKEKFFHKSFQITIILHKRKLYFLGPKIDIKNIKTSWF